MADTSSDPDKLALVQLARALRTVKLEALVIGNSGSILNGAPVTTQDIDLLIRDTLPNRRKLALLAKELGASRPMPVSELSRVAIIEGGLSVPVEVYFDRISGGLTFGGVRSRAELVDVGGERLSVASLPDIIRSKEAADRPKDRAVLPLLRETLKAKRILGR